MPLFGKHDHNHGHDYVTRSELTGVISTVNQNNAGLAERVTVLEENLAELQVEVSALQAMIS